MPKQAPKRSDAKKIDQHMKAKHGHPVVIVGHAIPMRPAKAASKKPAPNALRGR